MILVQHHVNIDDSWLDTQVVGIYSDHFWAQRAIKECKAAIMDKDGETDWSEYSDHSFEMRTLTPNVNVWP